MPAPAAPGWGAPGVAPPARAPALPPAPLILPSSPRAIVPGPWNTQRRSLADMANEQLRRGKPKDPLEEGMEGARDLAQRFAPLLARDEMKGEDARRRIERAVREILLAVGEDPDREGLREMIAGKRSTFQMEKRYLRKDGAPVWVLLGVSVAGLVNNLRATAWAQVIHGG